MAETYTYTARNAYDPKKWEHSFSSVGPRDKPDGNHSHTCSYAEEGLEQTR
jgi:hypothetical protein